MPIRQFLHILVCSAVISTGSSCVPVGPNHQTPAIELPTSFSDGGVSWKRETTETQPTPLAWWQLYGDSLLTSLVERAIANNQDLAAAAARVREARELSRVARSRYFPSIDLGIRGDRTQSRFRGPVGGSSLENSFALPVDLSYELDVWGKVYREVEGARASEWAAVESLHALRLSISAEVAQTYWALRAVDADRALLARAVQLRRKSLELLTAQQEAGAISVLDLSRAETEVATAESERIGLDLERVELVNAVAVLIGAVATGTEIPEKTDIPRPPSVPTSIPSELLRQRPDIRAAEYRVVAANANIGVAEAAFYPSFRIDASTGLDSATLASLFNASAFVWSVGPSITIPITGQKLLRHQRDAAVAAHEAVSAEYRQTVLDAIREVENALQGTTILARRQQAQERALLSARKTYDFSFDRFDAGFVDFLDVVDAERTRLESERIANAVRAERLAVSVALIKSLGGRWN